MATYNDYDEVYGVKTLTNGGVEQMSVYGGTKRYIDANSLKEDIAGARIIQKPKYLDAEETFGIIDMQPTAEVEEVNHGYWIEGSKYKMNYSQVYRYYTCSNCRFTWELFEGAQKEFKRCPYCEFKMDMETKREDDLV